MKACIDGDILVYTIGFACQKNIYTLRDDEGIVYGEFETKKAALDYLEVNQHLPGDIEVVVSIDVSPPEHAFYTVKKTIQRIVQGITEHSGMPCSRYTVYLTGEGNFREGLATIMGYKMNRADKAKPLLYEPIRDYLINIHKAVVVRGMEADDALSIVNFRWENGVLINTSKDPDNPVWRKPERVCIATLDKDLDGCPGDHFNFTKDKERYYRVDPTEANRFFYKQLLTGDSSDNILGIPKVGPAAANKLLKDAETEEMMYKIVLAQYQKFYGVEEFEYWHWQAYTDPTASYSKRVLKPEEDLKPEWKLKGTAESMLLENARLLYMLRQPVNRNGDHLWNPPKVTPPPINNDEPWRTPAQIRAEERQSDVTRMMWQPRFSYGEAS